MNTNVVRVNTYTVLPLKLQRCQKARPKSFREEDTTPFYIESLATNDSSLTAQISYGHRAGRGDHRHVVGDRSLLGARAPVAALPFEQHLRLVHRVLLLRFRVERRRRRRSSYRTALILMGGGSPHLPVGGKALNVVEFFLRNVRRAVTR